VAIIDRAVRPAKYSFQAECRNNLGSTLDVDADGNTLEAFTPDFYLPEQGLYLEITTMKQSLVTKKNRKLRRLRELRPDVRVKLFYRRDVEALAEKYELGEAS